MVNGIFEEDLTYLMHDTLLECLSMKIGKNQSSLEVWDTYVSRMRIESTFGGVRGTEKVMVRTNLFRGIGYQEIALSCGA